MQNNYNNFNCYLLLFVVRYKKMRLKLIGFSRLLPFPLKTY